MITFREFLLLEYISNPLIWFKNFINSDNDEKANHIAYEVYTNGGLFDEYIDEEGWDKQEFDDLSEKEKTEFGQWLIDNDKLQDVLFDEELPSWWYMDNASVIKNTWLVHESNSIDDIIRNGFQYGIEDYTKLGLTTRYSDDAKKRHKDEDFYLFSYTSHDFDRYGKDGRRGLKYGDEFVVFRSSGVRVYHNSDDEYQTIFSAREARDFVPVFELYGDYVVNDVNSGRLIYKNENPTVVVNWIINNYEQYKNRICQREKN